MDFCTKNRPPRVSLVIPLIFIGKMPKNCKIGLFGSKTHVSLYKNPCMKHGFRGIHGFSVPNRAPRAGGGSPPGPGRAGPAGTPWNPPGGAPRAGFRGTRAGPGRAGPGRAGPGRPGRPGNPPWNCPVGGFRPGRAGPGRTWPGRAGPGRPGNPPGGAPRRVPGGPGRAGPRPARPGRGPNRGRPDPVQMDSGRSRLGLSKTAFLSVQRWKKWHLD